MSIASGESRAADEDPPRDGSQGREGEREAGSTSQSQIPTKRIRRRAGPFKRSRTGCGTCKRRGKKCDEDWTPEGFCQRCIAGQFDCAGRTGGPSSDSVAGPSLGAAIGRGVRRVSGNDEVGPARLSRGDGMGVSQLPAQSAIGSDLTILAQRSCSSSTTFVNTPNSPVDSNPLPHTSTTSTFDPSITASNYAQWTNIVNHPTPDPITTSIFSALPFAQPSYDWTSSLTQSSVSATTTAAQLSAHLTTNTDGSLAIDSATLTWNTTDDMWSDLGLSFVQSPHQTNGNAHHSSSAAAGCGGGGTGGNSRLVFINSKEPMRQGVSLAEIYARVVESWLVGIPSTTRDYARARILALNDNNSVMRNVRYAVAAAYIFLFASDSQDVNANQPQPKLVEMAWQGAGIIDGQAGTATKTKNHDKGINGSTGNASKKIRLYVDHVSTPFAADLESTKWTEDAIQELREVIVTEQAQLSDLLWGVIDLQLVEFIRGGAAPSYNMLALGDRLVRSAMGKNRPPLTLSTLRTHDTFSLRLYALSDISRCIVQRGRKTIFNFGFGDHAADVSLPLSGDEEPWATYLGLPDSIVILLAKIVNLCAEYSSSSSSPIVTAKVKADAEEIESALRGWQSRTFIITDSVDSAALVSRTIAGELWRLSALILLYQSVHRVGGLHPVIRKSQKEILSLLDSISQLPNGDLFGFIALPAFLAATLSLTEADRNRSMKHLTRPGPERVWLDNIALVEKLWEEVDETGRLPDWHDKMTREGLSVAFF
ncbi:hypothetical protein IAR55_005955 [Kwoniella newhampshirensis]|uniref:Zn(2)-C6 fungal-type domain-containing protein n=1 Tax=Kwoniella newhampshirensis TaxID=1651941 RepID=A0AAW0YV18_9TREE